ncbi:hypothetical protein J6590_098295, partial [Homalodisca vitripennis]
TFEKSCILSFYCEEKLSTQSFIWRCSRLKRRITRIRPDIKVIFKLHHGNATSHTAFDVTNYPTQNNTPLVPQRTYSHDIVPCAFLYHRLKRELKGKHWESEHCTFLNNFYIV